MNILKFSENLRTELRILNLAENSIDTYDSCLKLFLSHFEKTHKEPKEISEPEIKQYLLSLSSRSLVAQNIGMLKHFYKRVIKQKRKLGYIQYPKKEKHLPEVLTRKEVQCIIDCISNLKHKTIIALIYSCGMRISEPINLLISDFNSKEKTVKIRNGKGRKDRILSIPENIMLLIIQYYWIYHPIKYMFNGKPGEMYSTKSINEIFKRAVKDAGINRKVTVHTLRHSFATHHVENGTSDSVLMELLGHSNIKTVQVYKHLNTKFISSFPSPAVNLKF